MKKIISFVSAIAAVSAFLNFSSFAADDISSVPAVYEEAVSGNEASQRITGDVNGDNEVLISDLAVMQKWLYFGKGDLSLSEGDLNDDGVIDIFDMTRLRKILLETDSDIKLPDSLSVYNICQNITTDESEEPALSEEFINGQMDFAVDIFKNATAPIGNSLVSPYSLMQALAMTTNGADSETREEMEEALGGMKIDELNKYLSAFNKNITKGYKPVVSNVNSIWAVRDKSRMAPRKTFLNNAKKYYDADFYLAQFNEDTAKEMNKYVEDKTDGLIKDLVDKIDPNETIYLINTVTFNADWKNKYFGDHKPNATFINVYGEEQPCTLMLGIEKYIGDENTDGFIKEYANNSFAFAALLPQEGTDIKEYIDSLTGEKLRSLLTQESTENASCALMKFGFRYKNDLKDELRAMGMNKAFDGDSADFSRLSSAPSPTYLNDVSHSTYINVNEKGTYAAAATAVRGLDGGGILSRLVILDRPFVYCIFDTNTGIPLFIGTIMDMDGTE